ncbi:hypothetical protein HBB16_10885 [Pseudonocardia sp. MCCB 268]|nr:hypothetical protein [Pseudonocardia cytotoxica]
MLRDGPDQSIRSEAAGARRRRPARGGARVPTDLRLTETWGLRVDEAALTGESGHRAEGRPPGGRRRRGPRHRANLAFAGTTVAAEGETAASSSPPGRTPRSAGSPGWCSRRGRRVRRCSRPCGPLETGERGDRLLACFRPLVARSPASGGEMV